MILQTTILLSCVLTRQNWTFDHPEKSGQKLDLSFHVDGDIWRLPAASVLPRPMGLFRKSGPKWTQIEHMRDLRGLVRLQSASDALDFVRLRTNSSVQLDSWTFNTSSVDYFEILPRPAVNLHTLFGDKDELYMITALDDGVKGVVSEKWFKEQGLFLPQVAKVPDGWDITRCVLRRPSANSYTPCILFEHVTSSGAYSAKEGPKLAIATPHAGWRDFGPRM